MTLSSFIYTIEDTVSEEGTSYETQHTSKQDESGQWISSEMSELQEDGGQGGRDAEAGGEARGVEHGEGLQEGGGQAAQDQVPEAGQRQRRLQPRGLSLQRLWLGRADSRGSAGPGGGSHQELPRGQGLLTRSEDG